MIGRFKRISAIVLLMVMHVLRAATYADEAKSYDEWLRIMKEEEQRAYKAKPDLPVLEIGASLALSAELVHDRVTVKDILENSEKMTVVKTLTPNGRKYYDAYVNFLRGPGERMLEKWRTDGCLEGDDRVYMYLINSTLAQNGGVKIPEVQKILAKCYQHRPLTRREIECLRLACGQQIKLAAGGNPYNLFRGRVGSKPTVGMDGIPLWEAPIRPTLPGEKLPAHWSFISLAKAESLGLEKDYRWTPSDVFTTKLLEHLRALFVGFAVDGEGKLNPDFCYAQKKYPGQAVSLTEMLGDKKGILINYARVWDDYDWYTDKVAYQVLYPFLKDEINVYFLYGITGLGEVSTTGGLAYDPSLPLVTPRRWSNRNGFFKNGWGDLVTSVRDGIQMYRMRMPQFSTAPMVFDLTLVSGACLGGRSGNGDYVFLDRNLAQCAPCDARSTITQGVFVGVARARGWAPNGKIGYIAGKWLVVDKLIRFIKIMRLCDWQYAPDDPRYKEYMDAFDRMPDAQIAQYVLNVAIGTMAAMEKGVLTLRDEAGISELTCPPDVRLEYEGEKNGIFGASLTTLKPGERLTVVWTPDPQQKGGKIVRKIYRSNVGRRPRGLAPDQYYVGAEVLAVDQAAKQVRVKMPKPDYPKEWRGYYYWEQITKRYPHIQEPLEDSFYVLGKKLLLGDEAARTFNLGIDAAVRFSIDGVPGSLKDVKQGDVIVFSFLPEYYGQDPLYPEDVKVLSSGPLFGKEK